MSLFEELKRRNVFRVGIAWVLMGWVVLQGADFVLDLVGAPDWVIRAMAVIGVAGLPIALFFAWAFEVTPEGIKRESEIDRSQSITPHTGRKLDRAIIVFLAAALALVLTERFFLDARDSAAPETGVQAAEAPKSIAVLPFADLSQAGNQEWFADGLAEEILNALAKTPDLLVASRTSSFKYKGSQLDIPAIAAQLGVAHVLEGSVRSSGDRIRVTAQLIRAGDGFHLWSENYDREPEDMIAIQEDLARSIAGALETTMDPAALQRMSSAGTASIEAYQEYLKGRALQSETGGSQAVSNRRVVAAYEHFERARALDPGFARAHLMAAEFWSVQLSPTRTDSGLTTLSPPEMLTEFYTRIDQAIANAGDETDRIGFQGLKAQIDLRLREAVELYQRYLAIRPNDAVIQSALLYSAALAGDKPVVQRQLDQARERGRSDALFAAVFAGEAYRQGRGDEAATYGLEVLERWPTDASLMYQVHRTLLWVGRVSEARRLAERYDRLVPEGNLLVTARQACAEGDRDAVEDLLETVDETGSYALSNRWHLHMLLGQPQEAQAVLLPYATSGVPFQLADFLIYPKFDPGPFPGLVAVIERERIDRPAPVAIPFKCPPPSQPSIAVLPFVNMSPDANNEYFADGLSEEILNVLTRVPDLKVTARTSAFSFKGSDATIAEIAAKLGVQNVLEGSVRKAGDRVRVTAQLIAADGEFHLWSETFDRELDDIFAVQDEIAQAIVKALELTLTDRQRDTLVSMPTENIEAYNLYLQGRQLWHQRGDRGLRMSIELLSEAVELDPEFAKAWAALADAYVLLPEYARRDQQVDARHMVRLARDASNRALELEPSMAQALTTRGYLRYMYDFDWQGAEQDLLKAMELEPTYPTARQWYGEFLSVRDRDIDRALEQLRQAAELDPLAPIMWHVSGWLASGAGRNEEALGYYQKALAISPTFQPTYGNMYRTYAELGRYDLSRQTLARARQLWGEEPPEGPSLADAMQDPQQKAAFLERLANDPAYISGALDKAYDYMLLGEPELAMGDLELAFEQGDPYAAHVNRMAVYASLRDNPRFQAHLRRMNLEP